MASIHKDIPIDAHPADVWAAVRDFGAVHTRLAPGFVLDARLDGDARIVTFANGNVARELLVDCDDARRRLVYAIANERVNHYSASVQVLADGDGAQPADLDRRCAAQRNRALYRRPDGSGRACHAEGARAARGMTTPFLDALGADGPRPTAPARWTFTGASSAPGISTSRNSPTTASGAGARGEWHFGWALEGRAIQDVWIVPPRGELRHGDAAANVNSYGTTLRVYDPRIDAWQIQWTDPVTQNFLQMIGRAARRRHRSARDPAGRPADPLELFGDHAQRIPLARRNLGRQRRELAPQRRIHRRVGAPQPALRT